MKIIFNPSLKHYQINNNELCQKKSFFSEMNTNINSLDCISNYNISFCSKAVYVIDYDGSYEKYDKINDAIKKYGKTLPTILHGTNFASGGKTYVYSSTIEDKDGNVNINKLSKALLAFRDAKTQPVYAVDYEGNIRRFESVIETEKALNIARELISCVLSDKAKVKSGYTFVKAFDLELRDKNAKIIYDQNQKPEISRVVLNKVRENFLYSPHNYPIASIDEKGEVRVYKNIDEIVSSSKNRKNNIIQAIVNSRTSNGCAYVKLKDVVAIDKDGNVLYNEDGTYKLDQKKINSHFLRVFCPLKK